MDYDNRRITTIQVDSDNGRLDYYNQVKIYYNGTMDYDNRSTDYYNTGGFR